MHVSVCCRASRHSCLACQCPVGALMLPQHNNSCHPWPPHPAPAGQLVEAMQRVLQAQREDLGTDMFLGDLAMDM